MGEFKITTPDTVSPAEYVRSGLPRRISMVGDAAAMKSARLAGLN